MVQSITSRQKQFLGSNYDIQLGEDENLGNYQVTKLDTLTDALYYLAATYVQMATDNLDKADAVASGALSSSIMALPVEILGSVYSVSIQLADYYKFVDQGVKGWADEKGGNSPYQFKNYGKGNGSKNSKMITAIRKWIIKQGLQSKAIKKPITRREKFQKSITDTSFQTALIISKSIKKKGLKPTHFWTDANKSVLAIAEAQFAAAIKIDIISSIYGNRNK
jgi:hypothetical protein